MQLQHSKVMKNMRGNYCTLLFVALSCFSLFGEATLKITDTDGRAINQASMGVPFLLHVVVDRFANDTKQPVIEGLEKEDFHVTYQGTTSSIQQLNQQVTVSRTFTYMVRIDKAGTFVIGPARVNIQGGFVISNKLTIVVCEQTAQAQVGVLYSMRATLDQPRLYVGQQCQLTLDVLVPEGARIRALEEPDLHDFTIARIEGPEQSCEEKNGVTYDRYRWIYYLYPKKGGNVVIPAGAAHVQPYDPSVRSLFALLQEQQTKKIFSNAVKLEVLPLPSKAIDLVGRDITVQANLDKQEVHDGEGCIYTVTIQGDADFSAYKYTVPPTSDQVRVFYAKEKLFEDGKGKYIEFVVQPLEPGTYIIPAGTIRVFDPITEKIETKKISEQRLVVKAGKVTRKKPRPLKKEEAVKETAAAPEKRNTWAVPHWLFMLLSSIPLIGACVLGLYHRFITSRWYRLQRVYKKITMLKNNNDYKSLYTLFLYESPQSFVLHDTMKDYIDDQAWKEYCDALAARAFAQTETHQEKDLFNDAYRWIKRVFLIVFLLQSCSSSYAQTTVTKAAQCAHYERMQRHALWPAYCDVIRQKKEMCSLSLSSWRDAVAQCVYYIYALSTHVFIAIILLLAWYAVWVLWYRTRRRVFLYGIVIWATIYLLVFGVHRYICMQQSAYVEEAVLRAGPDDMYHSVGSTKETERAIIQKENNGYYLIKVGQQRGWIKKEYVHHV